MISKEAKERVREKMKKDKDYILWLKAGRGRRVKTCVICDSTVYKLDVTVRKNLRKAYQDSYNNYIARSNPYEPYRTQMCWRCYLLIGISSCFIPIDSLVGKMCVKSKCTLCMHRFKCVTDGFTHWPDILDRRDPFPIEGPSMEDIKDWILDGVINKFELIKKYTKKQWRDWIATLARKEDNLTHNTLKNDFVH